VRIGVRTRVQMQGVRLAMAVAAVATVATVTAVTAVTAVVCAAVTVRQRADGRWRGRRVKMH
jgi:hypothetical protein